MIAPSVFTLRSSVSADEIIMLESHQLHTHGKDAQNISAVWFVVLFAVITYVALSTRAVLNPFEIKAFIDPKRILSVLTGAGVLSLAIKAAAAAQSRAPRAQILSVLQVSSLGIVGVLLVREIYDLVTLGDLAQRLGLNIRWILGWTGYFAAAVATFIALSYHHKLKTAEATIVSAHAKTNSPILAEDQANIVSLLTQLRGQAEYETADPDIRPGALALQKRRATIDRLLAELSQAKAS